MPCPRRVLRGGSPAPGADDPPQVKREQRNAILRARDTHDYTFTEWIYGPTALTPEEEPEMYPVVPLDSVKVPTEEQGLVSAR